MKSGKFNVVTDLQFGSVGKGLISGYLAYTDRPEHLSTTSMANAGHTIIITDDSGEHKFIAKALPAPAFLNAVVDNYHPHVWIGPSAAFTMDRMLEEIEICKLPQSHVHIHPRAGVITEEHRMREASAGSSVKAIASTMQGCGAFSADKIMRSADLKLARDYPELFGYIDNDFSSNLYTYLKHGSTCLHEGSQGFSLDINHGHSYPQCYAGGTLVTVQDKDGNVSNHRISDVVEHIGDYEAIFDRGGFKKIKNGWKHKSKEKLLAIMAGNQLLAVTASHPVIVWRDKKQIEICAKDVRRHDWVLTDRPARGKPTKKLTPAMAYTIGYFLGDGWIHGKERPKHKKSTFEEKRLRGAIRSARYRARKRGKIIKTVLACVSCATEFEWSPKSGTYYCDSCKIKKVGISRTFGVVFSSANFHRLEECLDVIGYTKKKHGFKLYVNSAKFARSLLNVGIRSEGAHNKRLMSDFMDYDNTTLATILAGHIDADGCVYNNRIQFGISSLHICLQWQKWLHSIGVPCKVRHRKKYGNGYSIRTPTNHYRLEFRFYSNHVNLSVLSTLIEMSSKMSSYQVTNQTYEIDKTDRTDRPRKAFSNGKSMVWSISELEPEMVYDLETESGTFIANGILVHNCTSRQTTAIQNLADMGLPTELMGDVYGVFRPYPIRVGNIVENGELKGHSGGCYDDHEEITWEEVAQKANAPSEVMKGELTTVTKRLRRVYTFSYKQVIEATRINGVTKLVLNFANYLDWSCFGTNNIKTLPAVVNSFITSVEDSAARPIRIVGTGPDSSKHVIARSI